MSDNPNAYKHRKDLYTEATLWRIFRFIQDYHRTVSRTPTVRQICLYLSITSTECIYKHLKALHRLGHLENYRQKIILSNPPLMRANRTPFPISQQPDNDQQEI